MKGLSLFASSRAKRAGIKMLPAFAKISEVQLPTSTIVRVWKHGHLLPRGFKSSWIG